MSVRGPSTSRSRPARRRAPGARRRLRRATWTKGVACSSSSTSAKPTASGLGTRLRNATSWRRRSNGRSTTSRPGAEPCARRSSSERWERGPSLLPSPPVGAGHCDHARRDGLCSPTATSHRCASCRGGTTPRPIHAPTSGGSSRRTTSSTHPRPTIPGGPRRSGSRGWSPNASCSDTSTRRSDPTWASISAGVMVVDDTAVGAVGAARVRVELARAAHRGTRPARHQGPPRRDVAPLPRARTRVPLRVRQRRPVVRPHLHRPLPAAADAPGTAVQLRCPHRSAGTLSPAASSSTTRRSTSTASRCATDRGVCDVPAVNRRSATTTAPCRPTTASSPSPSIAKVTTASGSATCCETACGRIWSTATAPSSATPSTGPPASRSRRSTSSVAPCTPPAAR